MSDTDDQNDDLGLTEDEAKQLLSPPDGDDSGDSETGTEDRSSDRDDSGLAAELAKWKSLARKHEKAYKETSSKLQRYEDEGKTELQRLQEERDRLREASSKASAEARALRVAIEAAPEHASLAQVRAVAKRVRGDDDEELEADARELFELLAPAPSSEPKPGAKTSTRPQPRLKGGTAEPDEEPEETDPRKLAALLPRRR